MSHPTLVAELEEFLARVFPGATLYDGYFFVLIPAPEERFVRHAGMRVLMDKLCANRCWLVAVNLDPRPYLQAERLEQQTVEYRPDWNVLEHVTQWIAEVRDSKVDSESLLRARKLPYALALIDPDRRVALDVNMRRLRAPSREELDRFVSGLEDGFTEDTMAAD